MLQVGLIPPVFITYLCPGTIIPPPLHTLLVGTGLFYELDNLSWMGQQNYVRMYFGCNYSMRSTMIYRLEITVKLNIKKDPLSTFTYHQMEAAPLFSIHL